MRCERGSVESESEGGEERMGLGWKCWALNSPRLNGSDQSNWNQQIRFKNGKLEFSENNFSKIRKSINLNL